MQYPIHPSIFQHVLWAGPRHIHRAGRLSVCLSKVCKYIFLHEHTQQIHIHAHNWGPSYIGQYGQLQSTIYHQNQLHDLCISSEQSPELNYTSTCTQSCTQSCTPKPYQYIHGFTFHQLLLVEELTMCQKWRSLCSSTCTKYDFDSPYKKSLEHLNKCHEGQRQWVQIYALSKKRFWFVLQDKRWICICF